jgi:hypothetical protein
MHLRRLVMACLIEDAALLLRGSSHGVFSEVQPRDGVVGSIFLTSRAATFENLDNDGAMDIIVVNRDAPITLLRNIAPDAGHWMLLHVLDEHGRRGTHSEPWSPPGSVPGPSATPCSSPTAT